MTSEDWYISRSQILHGFYAITFSITEEFRFYPVSDRNLKKL